MAAIATRELVRDRLSRSLALLEQLRPYVDGGHNAKTRELVRAFDVELAHANVLAAQYCEGVAPPAEDP